MNKEEKEFALTKLDNIIRFLEHHIALAREGAVREDSILLKEHAMKDLVKIKESLEKWVDE